MNPGAPLWGGSVLFTPAAAAETAGVGAGAVRINFRIDGAASWDAGAVARFDPIVGAALDAGLVPLGLACNEFLPLGQEAWNDDPDGDGVNDYVTAFADAAGTVIRAFSGRVEAWEIWNEPDCWSNPSYRTDPTHAGCTYILPRVYAKILAEVYLRVQDLVDAGQVTLVSGGLFAHDIGGSWSDSTGYLGELYAEGVWDWMEGHTPRRYPWGGLGYHFYINQGEGLDTGRLTGYLDGVRSTQTLHGDTAPLWITEFGWRTDAVSEAQQSANLQSAMALLEARGDVAATFWYKVKDVPAEPSFWGVLRADGSRKPAADAFAAPAATCTPVVTDDAEPPPETADTPPDIPPDAPPDAEADFPADDAALDPPPEDPGDDIPPWTDPTPDAPDGAGDARPDTAQDASGDPSDPAPDVPSAPSTSMNSGCACALLPA